MERTSGSLRQDLFHCAAGKRSEHGAFLCTLYCLSCCCLRRLWAVTVDLTRRMLCLISIRWIQNTKSSDQIIDEIVNTLRNMGNVHSLRGEQDEAMRYYSEVTRLQVAWATKKDAASVGSGNDSVFWGDEDTSTLISELNEDVKALDDLFRSISFRNGKLTDGKATNLRSDLLATSPDNKNCKRRHNSGLQADKRLEREVFKRSIMKWRHSRQIWDDAIWSWKPTLIHSV
jgi:hypothetical protein